MTLALRPRDYPRFVGDIAGLLEMARRQAVRSVNAVLTATYWEIGRRIIRFEQAGGVRAEYGEELIEHLSKDLTRRFGRGFSPDNLESMRAFYQAYPPGKISETPSRISISVLLESESVIRGFRPGCRT